MNSIEIYYTTVLILFTAIMWIPYILNRIQELGLWTALKNPQAEAMPKSLWSRRAIRAHMNSIENLAIFVPLVLIVEQLKLNSDLTASLCLTFLTLRIAHYFAYLFAIPLVRTVLFFAGFIIQLRLGLIVLGF